MQALRPEDGVHFFVSGGGGAALYHVRPSALFAGRTNGFTVLDADAARLTITLVGADGTTLYAATLEKPTNGQRRQ